MSDLHFANPGWFHAIWLVIAFVVLLFWMDSRGRAILDRFLSRIMQQRLARRISSARRWISFLLFGCAAAMLVVALMRPQWGLTYLRMPRVGAQLMVCLDVSKSMLAEDTAPNRLERAKVEIADLLAFLDGDQVGLIAFAGKAAVLCPLTPDFGFFRLILDSVGPHNVGRGGTKLEEPIRKALAGFRTESDVQRVILLVTDGEDHDSFPLEAAKEAAERGIKIIAIGFGDEAGSKIQVTDPRSGVRTTLRDNDGQEVTTSLDGEMLRDIVQVTDGIYVPAGTGTLDLASIYEAHIAPLTRGKLDDRGQAIRREGFQWAILSGLVFLIAAVAVRSGSVARDLPTADVAASPPGTKSSIAAILLFILAAPTSIGPGQGTVHAAQSRPSQTEPDNPSNDKAENKEASTETTSTTKSDTNEAPDPREAFNNALACLDTDLDRADQLLTSARRESGTDGEVRFRSTYNMGWVEVKRANKLLEDEPEQALTHLQAAADWFRDAIRLRPEHPDARHNLEIVLRRAMELADSLREKESGDLAQRLDKLIDAERQVVDQSSSVVMRVAAENDTNAADKFRSDFRRLAIEQRKTLSESQAVARSAGEELSGLQGKQDEELEPQQRMRAAQLSNVLHYVNRANQKLGQARSQMRRRQGERAFRRAAAGLDEFKRARDQLRNPDEVLGMILADAVQVAKFTGALAAANRDVPIPARPPDDVPAWLTSAYVQQSQASVTERCDELVAWLQAGLEQGGEEQPPGDPQEQQSSADQAVLEQIRDAMPFVEQGATALTKASESLTIEQFMEANQHQVEGIRALQEARERLLNLKGLIELTYADQTTITSVLAPAEDAEDFPEPNAELVQSRQKKNIERTERIRRLLDQEQQNLEDSLPAAGGQQPSQDPAQADAAKQRLIVAHQLLNQAESEMQNVVQAFQKPEPDATTTEAEKPDAIDGQEGTEPKKDSKSDSESIESPQADRRAEGHAASEKAVDKLQSLRRLFFSVVEHLRETAQRQAQLNDETEQAATLAADDQDLPTKLGPLAPRQAELESISGQIAEALQQQAQQNPAAAAGQQDQDFDQQQQMAEVTRKLSEAASLVAEGQTEMQLAAKQLNDQAPEVETVRAHQDSALQKLAEALALLVPPQQQNQRQQQQQQQSEQEQQQSEDQSQQPQTGSDPSRLLQAVRDREARRRREKEKQRSMPQETVEKDW
jgi:Ca-activated chloride channel family protein